MSTEAPKPTRACPACEKSDGLWAAATWYGWVAVDAKLEPARFRRPDGMESDTDDRDVDLTQMGCTCGWEGRERDLLMLGVDGRALPQVPPGQGSLLDEESA